MRVKYDDGTEEVLNAGDVFYLPAGHIGIIDEDTKVIEFNPEKEFGELGEHIAKKMAEMNG
jgi:ribosomal protein L16 Arg81 hydroxylase